MVRQFLKVLCTEKILYADMEVIHPTASIPEQVISAYYGERTAYADWTGIH